MKAITALLALALAAGCGCGRDQALEAPPVEPGPPVDPAIALAAALHQRYGRAETIDAEIYLLVAPPDTEHVSFSLRLVITPEHGVVLDGFKKGFEILDGHLAPDGEALLVLQREDYAVRGDLAAIAAERQGGEDPTALFVTQLPRLVDEVRSGPVPITPRYALTEHEGRTALRCIAPEGEALCVLDAAGERIEEKIIYRGHGKVREELLRLSYHKHMVLASLLRPRLAEARLPGDETRIIVKLARLERPDALNPLTFTMPEVPQGWPVRPLGQWLDDLAAARAREARQ